MGPTRRDIFLSFCFLSFHAKARFLLPIAATVFSCRGTDLPVALLHPSVLELVGPLHPQSWISWPAPVSAMLLLRPLCLCLPSHGAPLSPAMVLLRGTASVATGTASSSSSLVAPPSPTSVPALAMAASFASGHGCPAPAPRQADAQRKKSGS